MKVDKNNYQHIKGWGVDIDLKNEPTYPMKKYNGDDHEGSNWERPPLQQPKIEVLHSNERPGYSAVIGETLAPQGLSGQIRRYAFGFSESSYGHWLPLLLADRVNEIEGVVDDLKKGKVPNLFAERGWGAAWKYNRSNFIKKTAITFLAVGILVSLIKIKKSS